MKMLRFCVLLSAKPPHVCFNLFNILKEFLCTDAMVTGCQANFVALCASEEVADISFRAGICLTCSPALNQTWHAQADCDEKVKKESAKGCTSSLSDGQQDEKPSQDVARNTSKKAATGSSTKNVFTRLLKVAQHYLLESGKYSAAARSSPAKRSPALGHLPKTRTSTSFTQAQGRTRRSSSRRSQNSTLGGVKKEQLPSQDSDGGATEDSSSSSAWRVRSGPVGKVARRRSRGQSGRGSSLLLKNRSSRSQQTAAQTFLRPESSKNDECQETQSRHVALNEINFITCPMTASQVRESQLI
ncbi:uncharacterized protein LOC107745932 [Sinocyclocheilus rhinocerous]|uniref:uncharacterized protein LOC107745932 n=1 Tax=Sinocyclocheilus rhinocerous TaxID=307959 RepID=UPI0007B844AC|nr:PREDICTED: uncharacterized protein LOC107745932 [Sinocyclocheilus rhinocerous]